MKSIKFFAHLILISIVVATSLTACSNDIDTLQKVEDPSNTAFARSDVRVTAQGYVQTKFDKKAFTRGSGREFKPEDFQIRSITESQANALSTGEAGDDGSSVWYAYKWVTLNYLCKTADGSQKELSELVVMPYRFGSVCSPSQLIIGCHSTITSDEERPTNFSNLEHLGEINMLALFTSILSQNALVIVPDYEGYGSTKSIAHPYCNRELTAEQVVTGAKAALSYFEQNVKKMEDGWSGVAIGYSQGGAVAAGVLRYCQQHGETSLRLKGAVCGDGPYDPLATLKRYISMDKLYMPVAPTLLLKGAIDTDPEMAAAGCDYHDFVTEEFYATDIFNMIQCKSMSTDQIQAALLQHSCDHGDDGGFTMMALTSNGFQPYTKKNLVDDKGKSRDFELENGKGYNYCTVDQCLKPGVIAYFTDGTILGDVPEAKLKALERALAKNALTDGGFTPGPGFTFFHSTGDEVVPYCNLESVRNTWGTSDIKTITFQSYVTYHVATGKTFFTLYCGSLVDEILKGTWAPGEQMAG